MLKLTEKKFIKLYGKKLYLIQRIRLDYFTVIIGLILTVLAFTALAINFFYFKFPGNNYYPPYIFPTIIILIFFNQGLALSFNRKHRLAQAGREFNYFFITIALIVLATNAAQYTPFAPIDSSIMQIELYLGVKLKLWVAWSNHHPFFRKWLVLAYNSISYQIVCLPLLGILFNKKEELHEYYCLLLLTTLIGFSLYYFFPTLAPASIVQEKIFLREQYDTALKFYQIHHHIPPTTIEGGLIAMPSFHVIWALAGLHLIRFYKPLYFILIPLNGLLTLSCVLLGWHYVSDIIVSFIVILIAYKIISFFK